MIQLALSLVQWLVAVEGVTNYWALSRFISIFWHLHESFHSSDSCWCFKYLDTFRITNIFSAARFHWWKWRNKMLINDQIWTTVHKWSVTICVCDPQLQRLSLRPWSSLNSSRVKPAVTVQTCRAKILSVLLPINVFVCLLYPQRNWNINMLNVIFEFIKVLTRFKNR